MKKLFALVLAMLMICGSAFAEIDWSSMTDDEIKAAIEAAQAELAARKPADAEDGSIKIEDGLVLFDSNGVTATVKGEPWLQDYGERQYVYFTVVVSNESDIEISLSPDECSCNGWESTGFGTGFLSAGKKTKDDWYFYVTDAEIHSLDEIEEFKFEIFLYDSSTYKTIKTTEMLSATFD